jgi:hypothetical protein
MGNPDPAKICTSHAERQNLTIRMQMRRLTRLTNAFSKKWENLWAAYCVHFAWYNFVRRHQSLRVTPAMAAGITNHMWTMSGNCWRRRDKLDQFQSPEKKPPRVGNPNTPRGKRKNDRPSAMP